MQASKRTLCNGCRWYGFPVATSGPEGFGLACSACSAPTAGPFRLVEYSEAGKTARYVERMRDLARTRAFVVYLVEGAARDRFGRPDGSVRVEVARGTVSHGMRRMFKYPLWLVDGPQSREIPFVGGPRSHHVGHEADQPMVWCLVDDEAPAAVYRFHVVGTGHPVPDEAEYLGTCHTHEGRLVWHVFVEEPEGES